MTVEARDFARSKIIARHPWVERSLEVVREKRVGDDAVVALRFEDRSGRQRQALMGLRQMEGGWRQLGSCESSPYAVNERDVWQTWGGWSSDNGRKEVAGGWVTAPSAVLIRVTDPAGRVHEDAIEGGVAVLMWAGAFNVYEATVELLDADGQVIKAGTMRRPRG